MSKFSNLAFGHLITLIGLLESSHFPSYLCRLRDEVLREHLVGKFVYMDGSGYDSMTFQKKCSLRGGCSE
jgi:hypothetical protein